MSFISYKLRTPEKLSQIQIAIGDVLDQIEVLILYILILLLALWRN